MAQIFYTLLEIYTPKDMKDNIYQHVTIQADTVIVWPSLYHMINATVPEGVPGAGRFLTSQPIIKILY